MTTTTPTFVLLHGLTFDRGMWEPVLDALPPDVHAVAFDLPGHGQAAMLEERGLLPVVEAVRASILDAGIDAPIMVGHSIAGPISTMYSMYYPTTGVMAVDGSIHLEPFAVALQALSPQLAGAGFDQTWSMFQRSMHMERVPPEYRGLVRVGEHAAQQVVLSYQADLLERPLAHVIAQRDEGLERLREQGIPYLALFTKPIDPDERAWLAEALPQAEVEIWPIGHHFPHLEDPQRFADRLMTFATRRAPRIDPQRRAGDPKSGAVPDS